MSIVKRGRVYHVRVRPFGPELITVSTAAGTKAQALNIERALLTACRSGDYRALDPESRAVCVAMFHNRGWKLPEDLAPSELVKEELTLWRAVEIFLNYPGVKDCAAKDRYIRCLRHIVRKWGKDRPVKMLWIPDLRLYQTDRLSEGAAAATVNWELSTLSRLFGVMIELQQIESNPCRLAKRLSTKTAEREVYLSFQDVQGIIDHGPPWFKAVVQTAYYTGMRRGEILGLTWKRVNLATRMIVLGPEDTKEGHWKRVPIHCELAPVLEEARRVRSLQSDQVFLLDGRPPHRESIKNPWRKACKALGLIDPRPRFHDLRHTWRANARRSGMDPTIAESIMGHWFREKTVSERYGRISDAELIRAIDAMIFDNGKTEIWASR